METCLDPIALGLVLAAATFHAGWNRLLHDVPDRVATLAVSGLVGGVILLPLTAIAPPWNVWTLVVLSGITEAVYGFGLTAAYRYGALSLAYPLGRGTAPLLVVAGAWVILRQPPSPFTLAGAVLLGAGLVVVASRGMARVRTAAIGFAVLTGASIATYSLIDSQAVRHTPAIGYLGPVLLAQGILLGCAVRGDLPRWRSAFRAGAIIGFGVVIAYGLVLLAYARSEPGRVATLREISVIIALVVARERPAPLVWAGAALVVAGAILVAV